MDSRVIRGLQRVYKKGYLHLYLKLGHTHSHTVSRWSSIIAVAAQRALASSLLELPLDTVAIAAGEPAVHEVRQDERWFHAPASS